MCTDAAEHSDWFDVTQGLGKGCVRSPVLTEMVFTAVIDIVLVASCKGDVVLKYVLYVEKHVCGGQKQGVSNVDTKGCRMFYGDDAEFSCLSVVGGTRQGDGSHTMTAFEKARVRAS